MNKNTKLSLKELTDTVIEISRNGLSEAAKNFGGDIGSLKESIENFPKILKFRGREEGRKNIYDNFFLD